MGCNPKKKKKKEVIFLHIPVDRWNDFGKNLDVVIIIALVFSHIWRYYTKITFPYDILSQNQILRKIQLHKIN